MALFDLEPSAQRVLRLQAHYKGLRGPGHRHQVPGRWQVWRVPLLRVRAKGPGGKEGARADSQSGHSCQSARCLACKSLPKDQRPKCDPMATCSENFGECDCEEPDGEPETCTDCGNKKVCERCAGGACDRCSHGRNPGEFLCLDCSVKNVTMCGGCGVSVCHMCEVHHSRGTCDCDDGNFGAKYSESFPAWYHGGAGGRYTGPYSRYDETSNRNVQCGSQ